MVGQIQTYLSGRAPSSLISFEDQLRGLCTLGAVSSLWKGNNGGKRAIDGEGTQHSHLAASEGPSTGCASSHPIQVPPGSSFNLGRRGLLVWISMPFYASRCRRGCRAKSGSVTAVTARTALQSQRHNSLSDDFIGHQHTSRLDLLTGTIRLGVELPRQNQRMELEVGGMAHLLMLERHLLQRLIITKPDTGSLFSNNLLGLPVTLEGMISLDPIAAFSTRCTKASSVQCFIPY